MFGTKEYGNKEIASAITTTIIHSYEIMDKLSFTFDQDDIFTVEFKLSRGKVAITLTYLDQVFFGIYVLDSASERKILYQDIFNLLRN